MKGKIINPTIKMKKNAAGKYEYHSVRKAPELIENTYKFNKNDNNYLIALLKSFVEDYTPGDELTVSFTSTDIKYMISILNKLKYIKG